jgi:hypothetical protein
MKNWLKKTIKAGVPLVLLETYDAAQSIINVVASLGENAEKIAFFEHDIMRGLVGDRVSPDKQTLLSVKGQMMAKEISPNGAIESGNPFEMLSLLTKFRPQGAVIFIHSAHDLLAQGPLCQAIWNLRDIFKASQSILVLMTPGYKVPELLKYDVVTYTETPPDESEIEATLDSVCGDAGLTCVPDKQLAVNALKGLLTTFSVEQATALSLQKTGLDLQTLVCQRRKIISQTDGIEIREDKTTFLEIAGYQPAKTRISRKIKGKRPPSLILWLDEVREAFAGVQGDTSGVSQDQIGVLQTWIQDRLNEGRFFGLFAVGFPGTSKSMLASALRNEASCECIRLDLGAMKGSLVGESERKIRAVLKTIDALTSGNILAIATCNGIKGIPSAFISRFTGGTYFFDLPSPEENSALWAIKRAKFNIPDTDLEPESTGWTGREIHQCCASADELGISLLESSRDIAPFCKSNRAEIEELRAQAAGKWLSASMPGLYVQPSVATGRKLS